MRRILVSFETVDQVIGIGVATIWLQIPGAVIVFHKPERDDGAIRTMSVIG
jgi:hypothetical protein